MQTVIRNSVMYDNMNFHLYVHNTNVFQNSNSVETEISTEVLNVKEKKRE